MMIKRILIELFIFVLIIFATGALGFIFGSIAAALSSWLINNMTPLKIKVTIGGFTLTGVIMGIIISYQYIKQK